MPSTCTSTTSGRCPSISSSISPSKFTRARPVMPPASAALKPLHRRKVVLARAEEDSSSSSSVQQPVAAPNSSPEPPPSQPPQPSSGAGGGRGVAGGAVVAAVLAFAIGRLLNGEPTLAMIEQGSVPLEVALHNGKPTVLEFYANWCEICKELAPEGYRVEQRYNGDVNYVMLNIENSKWAPELAEFKVAGVPHFVFLDSKAQPLAAAIGKLPSQILEGNMAAMAEGRELPYLRARGVISAPPPGQEGLRKAANPRDHA